MDLRNKRILITGGYGLAGNAVHQYLLRNENVEAHRYHSSVWDLTNPDDARLMLEASRPEIVFHFAAAVGGIMANSTMPASFYRKNTLINTNILEACAKSKFIEKLCLTGSGCVYPEDAPLPLHEDSLWNGLPEPNTCMYGVTKRMLTLLSDAYREEFGLNSYVILPTNLYGPGDNFHRDHSHVIAGIINKIDTAKRSNAPTVTLWGDGTPTRDFLYIDDFAKMTVDLMKKYNDTSPINVGTGKEQTIEKAASLIKNRMEYEGEIIWDSFKPNGQQRRYFDCSKLQEVLGYKHSYSLKHGIKETVKWYNRHYDSLRNDSK